MAKKRRKRRRNRKSRKLFLRVLIGLGIIFVGIAIFFGAFYVTDIVVEGNVLYTDEQIIKICSKDTASFNSILMSRFHSKIEPEESFIESITVEYINRNKIRLNVNESTPVGYFDVKNVHYYVDKKGYVLKALDAKDDPKEERNKQYKYDASVSQVNAASQDASRNEDMNSLETGSAFGTDVATESDETMSVSDVSEVNNTKSESNTSTEKKEDEKGGKEKKNSSQDLFKASIHNLPELSGIDVSGIAVEKQIDTVDESVFQTFLTLDKLLEKENLYPDMIEYDEDEGMTLYFGDIKVRLGKDSMYEEKIIRVAAILPQLEGESGTLHLEDFDLNTKNIIFESDHPQIPVEEEKKPGEEEPSDDADHVDDQDESYSDEWEYDDSEENYDDSDDAYYDEDYASDEYDDNAY